MSEDHKLDPNRQWEADLEERMSQRRRYAELEKREGELIFAYNNLREGRCAEDVLKAIAEVQAEMLSIWEQNQVGG